IPGKSGHGYQQQNLGVAVPISFMPVGTTAGAGVSTSDSRELVQIMHISDVPTPENGISAADHGATESYGVGPDFACGVDAHFPDWTRIPKSGDGLFFARSTAGANEPAGFYLAVHRFGRFVVLEAFDT